MATLAWVRQATLRERRDQEEKRVCHNNMLLSPRVCTAHSHEETSQPWSGRWIPPSSGLSRRHLAIPLAGCIEDRRGSSITFLRCCRRTTRKSPSFLKSWWTLGIG